jgi:large subunit ribosomal protein L6
MSRVAKKPLQLPKEVELSVNGNVVHIKGKKGQFEHQLASMVELCQEDGHYFVRLKSGHAKHPMLGTTHALISNYIKGVSLGFEVKLVLVGIGYRASFQGNKLVLALGYSHPVEFIPPAGITIEVPSNTEILIKGANKQQVGQVAAKIRRYRLPERYKGKGIRYADEVVVIKETKKK